MPEETQKKYELTLILLPQLEEENLEKAKKEIEETINQLEGTIVFKKENIQPLAYPINKQGQGIFIVSQISISPETINAFSKELKLNNQILRHLITQIPVSAKVEKPKKPKFRKPVKEDKKEAPTKVGILTEAGKEPEKKPKKKPEEKIKLEEIDKKLDEIIEEI